MHSTTVLSKNEAKILVDRFASNLYSAFDMRSTALASAMYERLKHDEAERDRLERELAELSAGYNKYLDVLTHLKAHERSIDKLKAIIGYGATPFGVLLYTSPESPDDVEEEKANRVLRRSLELWEAIEQYLQFDREARIKDILEFVQFIGMKASRQSVEAAIKAHPKVFRVVKRKREKFVSLK